jgi:hypothetical protein
MTPNETQRLLLMLGLVALGGILLAELVYFLSRQ